jgi:transcription elongation factor GreA
VTLTQHELAQVDAEIHKLTELLAHGEVVEPQKTDTVVDIGETVVLQMDGDVETYTIVSPAESAPDLGRISYESPLGHSLLNHKVGDDIAVTVPAGLLRYRIVAVR